MPPLSAPQDVQYQQPPSFQSSHRRRGQSDVFIRSVTAANAASELATIRSLLPQHPFVTVHAEYPGCDDAHLKLLPPGVREDDLPPAARYALAKIDVDAAPLLELGITICGQGGRLTVLPTPRGPAETIWQVSFHGGADEDYHHDGRLSLRAFAAILLATRVVAPENLDRVVWVAFGGLYHFGFLLKALTGGAPLPDTHEDFSATLAGFLGRWGVFDARYLATNLMPEPMGVNNTDCDLTAVARLLDAPAVADGRELRRAAEKSLAASQVFMRTTALFFAWCGIGMEACRIYGLH